MSMENIDKNVMIWFANVMLDEMCASVHVSVSMGIRAYANILEE